MRKRLLVRSTWLLAAILIASAYSVYISNWSEQEVSLAGATALADTSQPSEPQSTQRLFLPLIVSQSVAPPQSQTISRMGFNTNTPLSDYPTVDDLQAGWYSAWSKNIAPDRPGGIAYLQLLNVHQRLVCGSYVTRDRVTCPYVTPYAYDGPSPADIAQIALANPGSIWAVGNECDRRDWNGGGQDEILPEVYIHAYHDIYNWIKAADPTARVAICGVIQPTPLRLEYLARIWTQYKEHYGVDMPVDVWNVHLFAMREVANDWGADIPPGMSNSVGAYNQNHPFSSNIDMNVFDQQVRAMRQFMADRGQKSKPLIVTEYGVLFDWFSQQEVQNYMLATFGHMLNTRDCSLSQVDDCRLVQMWAWFSLADIGWGFNPHTSLFNKSTKQMTSTGQKYRQFALDNEQALQYTP